MDFRGQLLQDRWVVGMLGARPGYFVDVGAADGIYLSNTYALEKQLGWQGICVEPGPDFEALRRNRSCAVDSHCLYDVDDAEVDFAVDGIDAHFSGIAADTHARGRTAEIVKRRTRTLQALLEEHGAPSTIDYLNIDTEGSEFRILTVFDFAKYRFNLITVEHNWERPKRSDLYELLTRQGYVRVRKEWFDDWYAHRDLLTPGRLRRERLRSLLEKPTRAARIATFIVRRQLRRLQRR